jgi:hypothetical protein
MNDQVEPAAPDAGEPRLAGVSMRVGAALGVHVEDQGGPDGYGRVPAVVRVDGVVVASLLYAAWPSHLVIFSASWEAHAPEDAEARLMQTLLAIYPGAQPPRLTHSAIHSLYTLRWYAASELAPGLIACGSFGARTLFYDPLHLVDVSVEPEPLMEGMPATTLTVMYVDQLRQYGEVVAPSVAQVRAWVIEGDALGRFVAIRRLATDPSVDPEITKAALYLSLLSENSGVRQFGSIHLGGFFPDLPLTVDPHELHELLRDPLEIWRRYGVGEAPPIEGWCAEQSRRNARYALGWTLGNMAWNAYAWGAQPGAEQAAEQIRALVERSAAGFEPARDQWLFERAMAEFSDDPIDRYGLGTSDPVDLFDLLRFSWLRWGLVQAKGFVPVDRFYWLCSTGDGIVGRGPTGDPDTDGAWLSPAAELIYAPPPSDALPAVEQMPPWLFGRNHHELYAPVELS